MNMEVGTKYENPPGCCFQSIPHTQYIATMWGPPQLSLLVLHPFSHPYCISSVNGKLYHRKTISTVCSVWIFWLWMFTNRIPGAVLNIGVNFQWWPEFPVFFGGLRSNHQQYEIPEWWLRDLARSQKNHLGQTPVWHLLCCLNPNLTCLNSPYVA